MITDYIHLGIVLMVTKHRFMIQNGHEELGNEVGGRRIYFKRIVLVRDYAHCTKGIVLVINKHRFMIQNDDAKLGDDVGGSMIYLWRIVLVGDCAH